MWLNGNLQWLEHEIGKKHKKNKKKRVREPDPEPKSKGLVIPEGMTIIIEQTAIHNDAFQRYMTGLYNHGVLRARL